MWIKDLNVIKYKNTNISKTWVNMLRSWDEQDLPNVACYQRQNHKRICWAREKWNTSVYKIHQPKDKEIGGETYNTDDKDQRALRSNMKKLVSPEQNNVRMKQATPKRIKAINKYEKVISVI